MCKICIYAHYIAVLCLQIEPSVYRTRLSSNWDLLKGGSTASAAALYMLWIACFILLVRATEVVLKSQTTTPSASSRKSRLLSTALK